MHRSIPRYLLRAVRSFTSPSDGVYSLAQKLLHWGIAVLCLAQVPTSWAIQRTHMAHAFMRPSERDLLLHAVHAWAGWTILALLGARLLFRVQRNGPGLPTGTKLVYRYGAAASHASLYVLLIALPVTGTLTMYISRTFAPANSVLAWTLLGLVTVHATAALWHQFVLRDGTLLRILPWPGAQVSTRGPTLGRSADARVLDNEQRWPKQPEFEG